MPLSVLFDRDEHGPGREPDQAPDAPTLDLYRRVAEAVAMRDCDGSRRLPVIFPVRTASGVLWSVGTAVLKRGKPAAFVLMESYPERTLALRAYSDRLLEHTFCEECREGTEPAVCPQDFSPCARRRRDRDRTRGRGG